MEITFKKSFQLYITFDNNTIFLQKLPLNLILRILQFDLSLLIHFLIFTPYSELSLIYKEKREDCINIICERGYCKMLENYLALFPKLNNKQLQLLIHDIDLNCSNKFLSSMRSCVDWVIANVAHVKDIETPNFCSTVQIMNLRLIGFIDYL